MEKVKSKSFFWIWSFTGLCVSILIWNLPWRFQVNDDEIMMWLVSGAYTGTPESYAVFIHPILSWTFSKLYTFAPSVQWYPLTWFLVMYLAYLVFLIIIDQKFNSILTKIVWCLFILGLFIHFLFFLQFSIVSAFAISAGLASRLYYLQESSKAFKLHFSDLLIFLGMLIRMEVLLLFIVGLLGLQFLLNKNVRVVKVLIIPMIILAFGYGFNFLWININGLNEFYELNKLRSMVFDHPVLQLNKDTFRLIDYQLFSFSNGLMDFQTDELTKNKLLGWKELLDQKRFEILRFKSIAFSLNAFLINERFFILIALLFFSSRIIENWRQALKTIVILVAITLLLSPFYLLKVQVYVVLFLLFLITSFSTSVVGLRKSGYNTVCSVVLISLIGFHSYNFVSKEKRDAENSQIVTLLGEAEKNFIGDLILIAPSEIYSKLIPGQPVNFRLLGWITLLENHHTDHAKINRKYLIMKDIYDSNYHYFEELKQRGNESNQIIIF